MHSLIWDCASTRRDTLLLRHVRNWSPGSKLRHESDSCCQDEEWKCLAHQYTKSFWVACAELRRCRRHRSQSTAELLHPRRDQVIVYVHRIKVPSYYSNGESIWWYPSLASTCEWERVRLHSQSGRRWKILNLSSVQREQINPLRGTVSMKNKR